MRFLRASPPARTVIHLLRGFIWLCAAVALTLFLVSCLQNGAPDVFVSKIWAATSLREVGRDRYPLDNTTALNIVCSTANVHITVTDEPQLLVVNQTAGIYHAKIDALQVTRGKNTLTVAQQAAAAGVQILGMGVVSQEIDIYLPASYHGDLSIQQTTGNVNISYDLSLRSLSLRLGNGSLKAQGITASGVTGQSARGSMSFSSLSCSKISLSSTDGSLSAARLYGAGHLSTVNGNITLGLNSLSGDLSVQCGRAGIVASLAVDTFTAKLAASAAGKVNCDLPLVYVSPSRRTASGSVGTAPAHTLSLVSANSDVTVTRVKAKK